jgi:hypothetical protein
MKQASKSKTKKSTVKEGLIFKEVVGNLMDTRRMFYRLPNPFPVRPFIMFFTLAIIGGCLGFLKYTRNCSVADL